MLIVLGGFIGFLALERLIGGGRKRNPEDEGRRCPLRTKMYGGLPGGGGYQSFTEYEIGAQRIAEAAHCLLGSLGKLLDRRSSVCPTWEYGLFYEANHIAEEMDIINRAAEEYSRSLYSDRILPATIERDYARWPDQVATRLSYAQKTVESIRRASPKLVATAESNLYAINDATTPEPIAETAAAAYLMVIWLARAMLRSVENYPDSITNAYRDYSFNTNRLSLDKRVKQLLAMRPKERAC
jgi:hypothetical protein